MAKTPTGRSAVANFAHLLGLPSGGAAPRAEDEDQDKKDRDARRAEEDARRAEEDERRKEEDARRAEEDGEGGGDDPEKDKGKRGKNADDDKPKDGDDEEADEDEDTTDMAKGRKAERARWVKTLSHPAAAGRVAAACSLLSRGRLNSAAIIDTLESLPAASSASTGRAKLTERMDTVRAPNPGSGGAPTAAADFGAQVAAAVGKVRPAKP